MSSSWKIFFSPIELLALDSFAKTFDSYSLDMMYVEFMKNFLFEPPGRKSVHKNFVVADSSMSYWLLDSF